MNLSTLSRATFFFPYLSLADLFVQRKTITRQITQKRSSTGTMNSTGIPIPIRPKTTQTERSTTYDTLTKTKTGTTVNNVAALLDKLVNGDLSQDKTAS